MYTRVVELTTKPEKARELCAAIDDKVLDFATLKWPHFDHHIWPHPNR